MASRNNHTRYSRTMIAIHWATALLIVAAWITSEGGRHVIDNPPLLHFSARLAFLRPDASCSRQVSPQTRNGSQDRHAVLYAFLIGLPLSGWYAASRLGVSVSFFGIGLPAIAAPVRGAPGLIAEIHENAGTVILYLAGLHALMAGWHHFALRDGTLRKMSPF